MTTAVYKIVLNVINIQYYMKKLLCYVYAFVFLKCYNCMCLYYISCIVLKHFYKLCACIFKNCINECVIVATPIHLMVCIVLL